MRDRIVVVDDNRAAADTLVLLIRMLGFDAKAVYSGVEAIEAIVDFQPRMAFIDVGMPECDGYRTAALVRERSMDGAALVLVALTGWAREEDKRRAYESGFDFHVTKPMRLETLKELLAVGDVVAATA